MADKQSYLEKFGIDERDKTVVRNDYTKVDEYSLLHPDALSSGDPQGKGTGNGGHVHSVPDHSKPTTMIDYSNFNTAEGGGLYDIEGRMGIGGRNFLQNISLYNPEHEYGYNSIDTSANEGQVRI